MQLKSWSDVEVEINNIISRKKEKKLAGDYVLKLQIRTPDLERKVMFLSGGNQQKIAVGRSITTEGSGVLLMNEPTRGVDIGARADIYALMRRLCQQGTSILMSSSDIEEVIGMSDTVITMYRGAQVAQYERPDIDRSRILSDILHQAS